MARNNVTWKGCPLTTTIDAVEPGQIFQFMQGTALYMKLQEARKTQARQLDLSRSAVNLATGDVFEIGAGVSLIIISEKVSIEPVRC